MNTSPIAGTLAAILDELANGMEVRRGGGPFVLNTGDIGLQRSLGKLSAPDAFHEWRGNDRGARAASAVRSLADEPVGARMG